MSPMSNQNQKRQIRAFMRKHGVNYTTARRAILGNAAEVTPQADDLSASAMPVLPTFVPFHAEGTPDCEEWHEQFRVGRLGVGPASDGATAVLDLAACGAVLVAGGAGSGKTMLINLLMYGVLANPKHAEAIVVDGKSSEYAAWVPESTNVAVYAAPEPLTAARDALSAAIKRMHTGTTLRQFVVIDDAAQVFSPMREPELRAIQSEVRQMAHLIASQGRSHGVHLLLVTQRPNAETLDATLRDLVGHRFAFGPMDASGLLMTLGVSESLPVGAPKGRARYAGVSGPNCEVQVFGLPVQDWRGDTNGRVTVEGIRSRLSRRGPALGAGHILEPPIDYPSIPAYNKAHVGSPAPVGDQSWAECGIPPLVDEYADEGRIAQFVPAGDDRPDRRGNLIVVPDGAATGSVRLLAVGVTVAQVRALVLDRPRTETDLLRALAARL